MLLRVFKGCELAPKQPAVTAWKGNVQGSDVLTALDPPAAANPKARASLLLWPTSASHNYQTRNECIYQQPEWVLVDRIWEQTGTWDVLQVCYHCIFRAAGEGPGVF